MVKLKCWGVLIVAILSTWIYLHKFKLATLWMKGYQLIMHILSVGKGKGKAIDFTSPRTSSGQASWPYETVPNGTISSPSEGGRKPQGENHQALAVKGERHPTCGLELNPGRSGERRMCYHGATKPQWVPRPSLFYRGCIWAT